MWEETRSAAFPWDYMHSNRDLPKKLKKKCSVLVAVSGATYSGAITICFVVPSMYFASIDSDLYSVAD